MQVCAAATNAAVSTLRKQNRTRKESGCYLKAERGGRPISRGRGAPSFKFAMSARGFATGDAGRLR
jgi:hypothetical protein